MAIGHEGRYRGNATMKWCKPFQAESQNTATKGLTFYSKGVFTPRHSEKGGGQLFSKANVSVLLPEVTNLSVDFISVCYARSYTQDKTCNSQ